MSAFVSSTCVSIPVPLSLFPPRLAFHFFFPRIHLEPPSASFRSSIVRAIRSLACGGRTHLSFLPLRSCPRVAFSFPCARTTTFRLAGLAFLLLRILPNAVVEAAMAEIAVAIT